MKDVLHPRTRQIIHSADPNEALRLAADLAENTPPDFRHMEWLAISVRQPYGTDSPRWYTVVAFAFEQFGGLDAPVDSLDARARLISSLGPDEEDPFQSLSVFIERARDLCAGTTPAAARASRAAALRALPEQTQDGTTWRRSADALRKVGRLRQAGRAIGVLASAGVHVPADLAEWAVFGRTDFAPT